MRVSVALLLIAASGWAAPLNAAGLRAGAAKVDISADGVPSNDPLYVKALVLQDDETTAAIITLDAVAIGEIGYIKNDYLGNVRGQLQTQFNIPPTNVMINASHCHGIVCDDVEARTVQAVEQAVARLEPVHVGVGHGHEDRIQENRRLFLKNGKEIDVRHAYSLPPDDEIAGVGPIDPEIGILRLDSPGGRTVAVVYNFACHPIQGVPSGYNTADITGFASQTIEDNFDDGTIALFVQGCGGDINPISYKIVDHPRSAEPLGNLLGLSTLQAVRDIDTAEDHRFHVINRVIELPRADFAERIAGLESEQRQLLASLHGTSLNFKTFVPLYVKYKLGGDFPAAYSHRYLHDDALGRNDFRKLDADNLRNIEQYINNIETMEQLTRVQTNLALLNKHQVQNIAAGKRTLDVEMVGLRLGDFVLVTFPGELTVRIGLGLKERSPHPDTFIAGYTNGYIYYSPTAEQLQNVGGAQEDSDCLLAPEWQEIFERHALEMLAEL